MFVFVDDFVSKQIFSDCCFRFEMNVFLIMVLISDAFHLKEFMNDCVVYSIYYVVYHIRRGDL